MRRPLRSRAKYAKMNSNENSAATETNSLLKLALVDVTCPICIEILIQPVTLPCNHELCLKCFHISINETSLLCPMCRQRISNWARNQKKSGSLVNEERWRQIQEAFPRKVKKKLYPDDYSSDEDDEDEVGYVNIAEPGEIRKEYETMAKMFDEEKRRKREEEEAASRELIEKLQQLEEQERLEKERLALSDEALARDLEKAMKESDRTMTSPEMQDFLHQKANSHGSSSNSKSKATLLDRFLSRGATKIDRTGQNIMQDGDAYPYRCISPWEKEEKKESPRHSATYSDIFMSNSGSNSTVSYVYVGSGSSSRDVSTASTPVADETGIGSQFEVSGVSRPGSKTSSRDAAETLLVAMSTGEDESGGKEVTRSASSLSCDSITQELNHFKPIRSCPKTPPRRLPSGQLVEVPVVRSTPRSMVSPGVLDGDSKAQQNSSVISSPLMKKRIEMFASERRNEVTALSKGTDTGNVFHEHSYSSPSREQPSLHKTPANSTVSMRELCRKSAVSTVTSSSALQTTVMGEESYFTSRKLEFDGKVVNDGKKSPNYRKRSPVPLLPLVPNLDEDEDDDFFNSMPRLERYDRGDTTEIKNLQISNQHPPNLLTSPGASSHIQGLKAKRHKSKQKAKPGYGWKKRGIDSSKTPKISKHFRSLANNTLSECESTAEGENKCTSDLVGVTDRLKEDTGSPNQPQFEFEKRVHTQVSKVQSRSPAKKGKEPTAMSSKYHKSKGKSNIASDSKLNISLGSADETLNNDTLKLKDDGRTEESCNEKVSRWFQTHNGDGMIDSLEVTPRRESPKSSSNKEQCNDTNNNTPTKAERISGQIVSNTANESPSKGPTRSKSTRYKPKKFFDVEGHDWSSNASSPARKKVMKINRTGQTQDTGSNKALKQGTDTEMDSDGSSLTAMQIKRGNRKLRIGCTSQSDQSIKSGKESTNATRDPLPQRKRKKTMKQMSESEFSEEEEIRDRLTGKPVRPSKTSKCEGETELDMEVDCDPSGVTKLSKARKPKRSQIRSTKTTLESSDYESETSSVRSPKKVSGRVMTGGKRGASEAESSGNHSRLPNRLEKPATTLEQENSTKGNGNSLMELSKCEIEVDDHDPDSKSHKPGNKERKPACPGTKDSKSVSIKSRKEVNREEYTPTDDGKKRKVTCIERSEDESHSLIKRMKQSRLNLDDTVKNKGSKLARRGGKTSRGKKHIVLRQQRVDTFMHKQNSNDDESKCTLPSAADTECESESDLSVVSERRDRSEFPTESAYKAYVEEQDRLYAERLNKEYQIEEKLKLTAFRFKGSEGAYSFRKKAVAALENEKTVETVKRSQRLSQRR